MAACFAFSLGDAIPIPTLNELRNYFWSPTNEDPSANTPPACVGSCGYGVVILFRDFFSH